jgi:hypothetical protein
MEVAADGNDGDGVFTATIDANGGMVAAASTPTAQLMMTTAIAAATIGRRPKTPLPWMQLCHCPFIPPLPLSPMTAIDKDHHCCSCH